MIDESLRDYEFSAAYEIRIDCPPSLVYQSLLRSDFSQRWLVRFLMTLRTGKWRPHNSERGDLHQRLQGTGFVILGEVLDKELVLGVAGQFWRLDGGRCTDLTPQQFPGFSRPGYAKVAWNFKLQSKSAATTVLSTETRIKCFGQALWKFRLYWSVVGPFSGLIRKTILKQVKVAAESEPTA